LYKNIPVHLPDPHFPTVNIYQTTFNVIKKYGEAEHRP